MGGRGKIGARSAAKDHGPNAFWIDHATVVEDDLEWLASVERLTLWNVKIPSGFLARLEKLWWLDLRGGSAVDLSVVRGANRLQYLAVNQVRGLKDLSVIATFSALRFLDLYGLPQIARFPSLAGLSRLECVRLGQMTGLLSLGGFLEAPNLRELLLIKKINVSSEDVERIVEHRSIRQFDWFGEDVPVKVWGPIVKRIGLPPPKICFPEEWFGLSRIDAKVPPP